MVAFFLLDGLVKKGVLSVADARRVCEDAFRNVQSLGFTDDRLQPIMNEVLLDRCPPRSSS